MPTLKSEWGCPKCERETGKMVQILAQEGRLICPENSTHKWTDTPSFFADQPKMRFKPELLTAQQTDIAPLKLTMKNKTLSAARKKYGDKLEATVAQMIEQLTEGDMMIVGETDLGRIKDRMGQRPSNSSELVGMIYAKMCEVDEAKEDRDRAIKDLKAYESMSPGRVVVDLGQNLQAAIDKADGVPVKLWLESKIATALQENWF